MKNLCTEIQKELPEYLDDSITPKHRMELENHLHSCADCREYVEFLREMQDSVKLTAGFDPGEEFWGTLRLKIAEKVLPVKHREFSVSRWLKRFVPTPIPRPVIIGIGVACVILLLVVVNPFFRNVQPEYAELEIGNPITDSWFTGDLAIYQELFSESSETNVVDLVFEDTLSESSYTEIFDGTIFNFLSQLSEEDYQTFGEFL